MRKIIISVIIVVKNGERYLSKAIESVINQTYPPDEILIGIRASLKKVKHF
ncbi:MAG: glycosyltransferase [Nostoc sp.]